MRRRLFAANIRMGEGNSMADNSLMMYSMLWMVIGFLLFFFRPQSLRNSKNISRRSNDDSVSVHLQHEFGEENSSGMSFSSITPV